MLELWHPDCHRDRLRRNYGVVLEINAETTLHPDEYRDRAVRHRLLRNYKVGRPGREEKYNYIDSRSTIIGFGLTAFAKPMLRCKRSITTLWFYFIYCMEDYGEREYIQRTAKEMIDNCLETSRQIKNMPDEKRKAPKPHKEDSLTADLINPDMNL